MTPLPWQQSWRHLAAYLTGPELTALRAGLAADDPALTPGYTTKPGAYAWRDGSVCTGGCAIGYAAWKALLAAANPLAPPSEGDVCRRFDSLCMAVGLGHQTVRPFLVWFDATPRPVAFADLLAEVDAELARRRPLAA